MRASFACLLALFSMPAFCNSSWACPRTLLLDGGTLYTAEQTLNSTRILVKEGKIESINENPYENVETHIRLPQDAVIIPGMIDIHMHGALGVDVMDAEESALVSLCMTLPEEGVTSFLATTMSEERSKIEAALLSVAKYMGDFNDKGAEIIGVHLEGPFIAMSKCGAQNAKYILNVDTSLFEKWQSMSGGNIKIVTFAPEKEDADKLVAYLNQQGIIASIGHTDASYEQALAATEKGASHCTHCYNAMTGLHHRKPGVVGLTLTTDLKAELIADGVHVHPKILDLTYRTKGAEGIILVSDSMRGKYLKDGCYVLGGQDVDVSGGAAYLAGTNTLAGSTLRLNRALANMRSATHASLNEMVKMTSTNAAKSLGLYPRKGALYSGSDADITVLSPDFEVLLTLCRGQVSYVSPLLKGYQTLENQR